MKEIHIGNIKIGPSHSPFMIAEMSGNHNQSLKNALKLVEAAKEAGAHAIKLQTYTADTMTIDVNTDEFLITDKNSLWYGQTLYQLYQQAHTPWEWHQPIFDRCKELGLIGFSTPFDATAVDFLETLNVPCYKIASLEITDLPLIRKVASTGKPVIISTGAATFEEISEAVQTAKNSGCENLILLKCTSSYPANPEDSNLKTIPNMQMTFDLPIGLSDHTLGIGAAIASVAFNACVIEKHLTLSRDAGGVDAAFSLEPQEFKLLAKECHDAWLACGKVFYGPTISEKTSYSHRRSIYFVRDVKKGAVITPKDIRLIRPGHGLAPKYYDQVVGKKAAHDVKRGQAIKWELLE